MRHLDGTTEHLGEPQNVEEVEDQVEQADDPQSCGRNAPWAGVRQLSATHPPEIQRHAYVEACGKTVSGVCYISNR